MAEISARGKVLLMRFEGINSPEAAETLKGAEIIAPREFASPLKNGEYYVEDLKGLKVINPEGKILGQVVSLAEGGNGSLTEVQLPSGEKRLVPFIKEFFGEVDFAGGKIELLEPWILEEP